MKTKVFYFLMGLLCLFFSKNAEAVQTEKIDSLLKDVKYNPIHLNLQIKNMHLWRGYRVTSGAMSALDLNYQTENRFFKAGIWGGAGFDGKYREFDYYVGLKYAKWSLDIWNINNFSDYPKAKIFDYTKGNTSNFVDVTLNYQIGKKTPINVSWSTIVQGRDLFLNNKNELKNAYSNFISIDYPLVYKESERLSFFTSYAFSFLQRVNFYGSKPNFVEIGLNYNKNFRVFKYKIPIGAKAMFNPEQGYGGLQLSVQLF